MSKADDAGAKYFVEFKAGEYVFKENALGSEMYIIENGEIEILKDIGGEERRLAVLEHGDFFGEMSILEGEPRGASARALVDSNLLQIDASTFDQMLRQNPEIAVRMLRKLSRRLRAASERPTAPQAAAVPAAPPAPSQTPAEPAPSPAPAAEAEKPPAAAPAKPAAGGWSMPTGEPPAPKKKEAPPTPPPRRRKKPLPHPLQRL